MLPSQGCICLVQRGQPQPGLCLHLHSVPIPLSWGLIQEPFPSSEGCFRIQKHITGAPQGWEITVREALWVKLSPNVLFGAGFVFFSERVPVTWTLLKAAAGEL